MKKIILPLFMLVLACSCKKNLNSLSSADRTSTDADALIGVEAITIPSVFICGQTWMQKNLNVATYRNGDSIPQIKDPRAWFAATTGAWCYYNNDATNGTVYGKLYNWYAVNDPRGLAPLGWHVASDAEWTVLTDCQGGAALAGGKLKERGTTKWTAPNTGASNTSRFTALPAGNLVSFDAAFYNKGLLATFWTSIESGFSAAYYRRMFYNSASIQAINGYYGDGRSVRCIKN